MAIFGERIVDRASKNADGAIYPNRVVTYGSADGEVKAASAGDDNLIGVSQGKDDNTTVIADGAELEIVTEGNVYIDCTEAVDQGDDLMVTGSAGQVCKAEHATAEDTYIAATAEETITDAGLVLASLRKKNHIRSI